MSLFQRDGKKTIALYASAAKLAARGRFYSDDAFRDYDVQDFNIDVSIQPERQFIQGRARLAMRVRSTSMASVTLRLAEALQVRSVVSVEYGRLLHLRVRGQDTLLVTLPRVVPQDSDLTLIVTYDGRLASQDLDVDTIAVEREAGGQDAQTLFPIEPHYLVSNRAYWYPQNPVWDFATATIRVTVPDGYRAVASGELLPPAQVIALRDGLTQQQRGIVRVPRPISRCATWRWSSRGCRRIVGEGDGHRGVAARRRHRQGDGGRGGAAAAARRADARSRPRPKTSCGSTRRSWARRRSRR